MPVTTLNWRALAPVTLAANTVNDALAALYTAGTAVTYADGSARVPGQDCAWTWGQDTLNPLQTGATTAAYCTPPTTFPGVTNPGTVIPQALLWCGSTAAPTATAQYAFPAGTTDARTASMIYVGQCKNPGAYSNWNSATPFTTGSFTGCARAAVLPVSAVWNRVYLFESQEAVIAIFARTSPNTETSWSGGGALGDPGIDALGETDGRVYGVFSSGSNNYNFNIMWNNTSDSAFFESQVAGQSRFGMFYPGTATIAGYARFGNFSAPTSGFLSRGNEVPLLPVYTGGSLTGYRPPPVRLREIFLSRDGITGQVLSNGGTVLGYVAAATALTTATDAAVLTR